MATQQFTRQTGARREITDLTAEVRRIVGESGVASGVCVVSAPHCTCSLYVNENESGLVADMLALVEGIADGRQWRHDRIDNNASAHLAAALVGNSVTVPVADGQLVLGTWQSVMLLELDGPRNRRVNVTVLGG